ncbi:MAG: DUF4445 domain-containing protein [Deltaproteobacteria bacterium]|nr:DUF4445 domain-containing protein [Deltaproteobacteria bacterium]
MRGFSPLSLIGELCRGDAVAVALALGLRKAERPALVIDVGTNSEILLGVSGTIFATSAALAPAFEGGEVEQAWLPGPAQSRASDRGTRSASKSSKYRRALYAVRGL